MQCLENIIGFQGDCNYDNQLAVDDLPLVTMDNAACIADERGDELMQTLIRRAASEVPNEFLARFSDFQFNAVVDRYLMTDYSGDYSVPKSTDVTIVIEKKGSDPFTSVMLSGFKLKAKGGTNRKIHIKNDCGDEWEEVININDCQLHLVGIKGNRIEIAFNAAHLEVAKTYGSDGCTRVCSSNGCFDIYSYEEGCGIGSDLYGLWIDACCVCDKEKFLCHYADLFKLAMQYKAGILFYYEILNTTRLHEAQVGLEQSALENINYYEGFYDIAVGKYVKGKYWAALDDIKNQLTEHFKHIKTACISCKGPRIVTIKS